MLTNILLDELYYGSPTSTATHCYLFLFKNQRQMRAAVLSLVRKSLSIVGDHRFAKNVQSFSGPKYLFTMLRIELPIENNHFNGGHVTYEEGCRVCWGNCFQEFDMGVILISRGVTGCNDKKYHFPVDPFFWKKSSYHVLHRKGLVHPSQKEAHSDFSIIAVIHSEFFFTDSSSLGDGPPWRVIPGWLG